MTKSVDELIRDLESGGVLEGQKAVVPAPAARGRRPKGPAAASGTFLIILAVMLVALIGSLPYISIALYPFALFVTLLHECGHALATIASGGSVVQLGVSSDLSGVTLTSGGMQALIAPAGYLGATLAGVALLLTPVRRARIALSVLAAVPLAALLFFHPASLFTAVWCAVFASALGVCAWILPLRWAGFLQIFLGVEAGLNAFRDLLTLLLISGSSSHIHTDATNMSNALFFPPAFWAVAWTVMSLGLLGSALVSVVRRDVRELRG